MSSIRIMGKIVWPKWLMASRSQKTTNRLDPSELPEMNSQLMIIHGLALTYLHKCSRNVAFVVLTHLEQGLSLTLLLACAACFLDCSPSLSSLEEVVHSAAVTWCLNVSWYPGCMCGGRYSGYSYLLRNEGEGTYWEESSEVSIQRGGCGQDINLMIILMEKWMICLNFYSQEVNIVKIIIDAMKENPIRTFLRLK